jgi:type II secretory pathway pseudopilin PulG
MTSKGGIDAASVKARRFDAFTIVELIVVLAVILVLSMLLLPARAKSRVETHAVIDLNNIHQILQAVHLYAGANSDFMPHPTWGDLPSGPTGWLYGKGMPDGSLFRSASAAQLDRVISNQMIYFRKGQLAPYVNNDQKLFDCPTDAAQRQSGNFKIWYFERMIKISSYGFAGAVSGFGAPKEAPNANNGATYKLSQFWPTSFLVREPDETVPFNFNDAGDNQENPREAPSLRHTGAAGSQNPAGADGVVLRGAFGGNAAYIQAKTFVKLWNSPAENDLRCGPGYR